MWVFLIICMPELLGVRQYPVYFVVAALYVGQFLLLLVQPVCIELLPGPLKGGKKVFLQTIHKLTADDHEIKLTQDKNKM